MAAARPLRRPCLGLVQASNLFLAPSGRAGTPPAAWTAPPVWALLLAHPALMILAARAGGGRAASLAACASFAVCLWVCLRLLRMDPLSPLMIYLYVLGLFHLGLAVPWALDLNSKPPPEWMEQNRIAPALQWVIAALGACQAGATLAACRWPRPRRPAGGRLYANAPLYHFGLLLFVLGCGMLIWGVRQLGVERLLAATHYELYSLLAWYDPRLFTTSMRIAPMGLYLACAAAPRRRIRWAAGALAAWCAAIFFLGFRAYAVIPAVTALAVLRKRGADPPRWAYAAGLAAALFAIPAAREMRSDPLAQRSLIEVLPESRPWEAIEEMGGSLRPLVHTLDFMEHEPLRWGRTYWNSFRYVFPNLRLDWSAESYTPLEDLPPNHWVTKLAAPDVYRQHGGLGFSAVAEPYMNFGAPGVLLFFTGLSFLLAAAGRIDGGRPTRLAVWAVALAPLLWTTRNDFQIFFRPAVWGLAAVWLARLAGAAIEESARARRPNPAPPPLHQRA